MRSSLSLRFAAVVVATVTTGVGAVAYATSAHPGEHFARGHADPSSVLVNTLAARHCTFDGTHMSIPVRIRIADPPSGRESSAHSVGPPANGWVTVHVTATVSSIQAGSRVLTSATGDLPVSVGWGAASSVRVPLDGSRWQPGVNECRISTWSVTPGAWLSED